MGGCLVGEGREGGKGEGVVQWLGKREEGGLRERAWRREWDVDLLKGWGRFVYV